MVNEDFTTYTEVDVAGDRLTVDSNTVTATVLQRNETAYVYKDFGVDHFAGDWDVTFTLQMTAANGQNSGLFNWCTFSNSVENIAAHETNNHSCIGVQIYQLNGTTCKIYLYERDGSSTNVSGEASVTYGTTYYCRMMRIESIGSYGRLDLYGYSDSGRTNQVFYQYMYVHTSKKDFQYFYPINSYNDTVNTLKLSGYIEDLSLNEPEGQPTMRRWGGVPYMRVGEGGW